MSIHASVLKNILFRVFKIPVCLLLLLLVVCVGLAAIILLVYYALSIGCLPMLEIAVIHGITYFEYWKEPPTALSKTLLHPAFFGGAYACAVSVVLVDVWCSTGPVRWLTFWPDPHDMQFLSAYTGTWTMPRTVMVLNLAIYLVPLGMFVGAWSYHSLAKICKEEHDALHVTAHQKVAHLARKSKTTHISSV